jgi:LDH2 family malate/lactate/ureidoglycolate dehydrogenase
VTADNTATIGLGELRAFCARLLCAAGLDGATAELVADSLVDAEARDIRSHGVLRTRIYAERLRAGMLDPHAVPRVVKDSPGGVLVDAGNAIGHVGAGYGVRLAMERAAGRAVSVVGVRNSNHCGTLAYFVRQATARGLVLLATSNAPPTMVYHGGRSRAVGTNPLAIGIPNPAGTPIVIDMATSATARGKIIVADQLGATIPPGWAVDRDGQPTTDPGRALDGSVLPFAGPKGSGLAMIVDLLCGGLLAGVTGGQIGDMYTDWDRPQRVSHLFIAIDPDAFLGRAAFADQVAGFVDRVHGLPPAAGVQRVLVPGEVEEAARRRAERDGVALPAAVLADLRRLATELEVPALTAA